MPEALPALADTTLIIIIALTIAATLLATWMWRDHTRSAELAHRHGLPAVEYPDDLRHLAPRDPRANAWAAGVLVTVALIGITSWTSQRDAADARALLDDPRLTEALATLRCAPPDAPLETMLMTIGTQADGRTPTVHCVYITAPLAQKPELRRAPPTHIAEATNS